MERQVLATRCTECGKLTYPTHFYCPGCGAKTFEGVPIQGEGKLLTWTRAYALSLDYAQRFLPLGIAELDMGIRATGQLAMAEPRTGMRIRVRIGKVRELKGSDVYGLIFEEAP